MWLKEGPDNMFVSVVHLRDQNMLYKERLWETTIRPMGLKI